MTDWTASLIVAGAGALYVRHRLRNSQQAGLGSVADIAKAGELFGLAADWVRAGDIESARGVLNLVAADAWRFAHDEVVAVSQVPRIAAMAGRMSPVALLRTPLGVPPATDRLAQVEALVAIANEIKGRTWRY